MKTVGAAAIYARISSDQDGRGLGVKRQVEDCRKLAKARGWTVAEEYVDNDVSAYSGRRRPAYERMLTDLAEGLRDAVVVYNLDRLHRRPVELEEFVALVERVGVTDVATVTADIDLGNDDGLFMARMLAAFAAKESGRRSARIRRKMEEVAAAGLPHGGSLRPFGYEQDRMTVKDDEAAIIRDVVARYLAGESTRSLTTDLNNRSISTVAGKPWVTTTLRHVIGSARIAGLREFRGEVIGPAAWPAIISVDEHNRVRALLDQRAKLKTRSPRRYLLSGLLRCGRCGEKLYSSARATSRRYVCLSGPDHGGCGHLTVVAEPVESLIAAAVLHRLDTAELADALAGRAAKDAETVALVAALADDQARLAELAQAYGDRQVSMREWLDAKRPIEARIDAAQKRIARATHTDALAGLPGHGEELRAVWGTLNLTRQAAIVAAVLDHAVVAPGVSGSRALDPNRVQPVWRL